MIDTTALKGQLNGLATRAARNADAEMWGKGLLEVLPSDILPDVPPKAMKAVRRLAKMSSSLGPRVVGTRKFGTIGDINWGESSSNMDEALREQDLESLADELLESAHYSGVLAGILRRDARHRGVEARAPGGPLRAGLCAQQPHDGRRAHPRLGGQRQVDGPRLRHSSSVR